MNGLKFLGNYPKDHNMKFQEHGTFTIKRRPGYLYINAKGPFNDELVHAYNCQLKEALEAPAEKPWKQLVILHGLALMIPAAKENFVKSLAYRKQRGLIRSAMVMGDVEAQSLVKTQFAQCYQLAHIEHAFFDREDAALEWLNIHPANHKPLPKININTTEDIEA